MIYTIGLAGHSQSGQYWLEMATVDLVPALDNWSARSGPLYRSLAAAVADAITNGAVPAGRLPSERKLATDLSISRTTVTAAYETLRAEGIVERRRGSGTWVGESSQWRLSAVPSTLIGTLPGRRGDGDGIVDLSGSGFRSLDGIPQSLLRLSARELRAAAARYVYEPLGIAPLRAAVAARYSDLGLPTTPDEIVITTGAQQAISIALTALARAPGTIAVESPTYAGALDAARATNATVVGLETDMSGIDPTALRELVERTHVRALYLATACHNPTGTVTGSVRRTEIIDAVKDSGTMIVDDRTLAELAFDPPDRHPLAAIASQDLVITIGSLSKVFWPGLRVGWLRAPASSIGRFAALKAYSDLGSSHPSQLIGVRLLSAVDEIADMRRKALVDRLDAMVDLLTAALPEWSWGLPQGGPWMWIRLPGADGEAFAQAALRHGVRVLPGTRLALDGAFSDHIRLCYALDRTELQTAVERLGRAWQSYRTGSGHRRTQVEFAV
jgi:DNA-binding transcriptional MocR family regulator